MRPSRPGREDLGRLNTPGFRQYLTDCRWCGAELLQLVHYPDSVVTDVVGCPNCDTPTTPPLPHGQATD